MNSLSCQTELGAHTVNSGALRLGASSAASSRACSRATLASRAFLPRSRFLVQYARLSSATIAGRVDNFLKSIPDYAGQFYKYTLASSILGGRVGR